MWYVLGAIVLLIICGIIASEFRKIAAEKGFDEGKYFWYPFLFGIIGCLLVVALPDRNQKVSVAADALPEL